jgi:GH25 family lysozyme M1 (1,4-beta-N-acetylmuramidase)
MTKTGKEKIMRTFSVDVSHWEGNIRWQVAAPAIGFAYYKCTDGVRFVDDQFRNNQRGCSEAGLPHAPYHYYQPSLDPIKQADHFIRTAGKEYKRYIVDVEASERDPKITQKLSVFLDRLEKLTSTRPAIYTSAGYWNDFIHPIPAWAGTYDLIVAHYTSAHAPILPNGWKAYVIWQFSDYWNFPGCDEQADANWFNGDLEQCRAWFGNYCQPIPLQPPATDGFKMRSLFDGLHIRQSPNMNARIIGKLAKDECVEVEQLGGNDVWVRHSRGWTAVERGGYRYMQVASLEQDVEK